MYRERYFEMHQPDAQWLSKFTGIWTHNNTVISIKHLTKSIVDFRVSKRERINAQQEKRMQYKFPPQRAIPINENFIILINTDAQYAMRNGVALQRCGDMLAINGVEYSSTGRGSFAT